MDSSNYFVLFTHHFVYVFQSFLPFQSIFGTALDQVSKTWNIIKINNTVLTFHFIHTSVSYLINGFKNRIVSILLCALFLGQRLREYLTSLLQSYTKSEVHRATIAAAHRA